MGVYLPTLITSTHAAALIRPAPHSHNQQLPVSTLLAHRGGPGGPTMVQVCRPGRQRKGRKAEAAPPAASNDDPCTTPRDGAGAASEGGGGGAASEAGQQCAGTAEA